MDGSGKRGAQSEHGAGWPTIAKDPGMGKSGQHVKRMAKDSQRG